MLHILNQTLRLCKCMNNRHGVLQDTQDPTFRKHVSEENGGQKQLIMKHYGKEQTKYQSKVKLEEDVELDMPFGQEATHYSRNPKDKTGSEL